MSLASVGEWYIWRTIFSLSHWWLSSQVLCWDLVFFKRLLNWLEARWHSSVIPFLCASSLMFHTDLEIPRETWAWHACSRRWVPSEGTLLQRRRYIAADSILWRCQSCQSHIWGLPVVPRQRLKALPLCLESVFRLQFRETGLSSVFVWMLELSGTLCEADFREMVEEMFWQQCVNLTNSAAFSKVLMIWVRGWVCLP